MKLIVSATILLCLASIAPAYEANLVLGGLNNPIFVTHVPGDSGRLFIVEQGGLIRIFDFHEGLLDDPFLDLSGIVSGGGERGLLGMAFHPDYDSNGYFYVNFTRWNSGCVADDECTKIFRYELSGNPNLADPGSGFELLEIAQPYGNHNGGMIAFSPIDEYLYIGMGDGGSGGDPFNNSQNDLTLLGKMLRLDVDGGVPYGIPPDNPFLGEAPLDEIWAKGLRNPWRFSFDRQNGDLWIGDVGQNAWEEVDFQPASSTGGENYGWRLMEGAHCYDPPVDCDDGSLVYPVHEYSHGSGCSITGGYLYRGSVVELQGLYLFADYCNGRTWALDPSDMSVEEILTDQNLGNIVSFGEDTHGEVYIVNTNSVWKIGPLSTGVNDFPAAPSHLRFGNSAPNPFKEHTHFKLALDEGGALLEVDVFTISGRKVRSLLSEVASAGEMNLSWDGRDDRGRNLSSGVYFLRARSGSSSDASPVILIR